MRNSIKEGDGWDELRFGFVKLLSVGELEFNVMKTVHHSLLVSAGFLMTLGTSFVQAAPNTSLAQSPEPTRTLATPPGAGIAPGSSILNQPIVAPPASNLNLGNEGVSKDVIIPTAPLAVPPSPETAPTQPTKAPVKPDTTIDAMPPGTKATPLTAPAATTETPVVPAPDFLTTPTNPLLFPTKPEEVELKGVRALSLQETIELAERNNRDLAISRLQVEQQQAAVQEADANRFPTLDLQSSLTRSLSAGGTIGLKAGQAEAIANAGGNEANARLFNPQAFRRSLAEESTSWDTSLQLNYSLYNSGGSSARRRAAAGGLRAAELAMERVREQLRLDVTGDYYDLQEANEQVKINDQAVKNSEQSLKDANAQERAGLGTRFDVLRSEVQLANNQQQLTNALATEEVRRRQIAQRLSLPEYVTVSAADPVKPIGKWIPNLETTIVTAYKQRVELEEQLVQRDISDANRQQALSALGPSIQLRASYNLLKVFEQPVGGPDSGYSIAAVAQWRLFDGGAARAQAKQQEINKQVAETRFTQSRNNIRFQVEQAYATLEANEKNITTTTKALGQACEAKRLAKLRFDAGVGTQTDVLNAETDLTRSAGSRVSAILGYNRSIAQLLRSVSNVTKASTTFVAPSTSGSNMNSGDSLCPEFKKI
jgi:outer membrane protein TolC